MLNEGGWVGSSNSAVGRSPPLGYRHLDDAAPAREGTREVKRSESSLRRCAGGAPGTLTPVPSKTLDLVWHTHQLHPRRYAQECALIAGSIINHVPDDD